MIPPQHVQTLKIIDNSLRNTDIFWVITGSLGFALQGMEIEVNDIDIQTDSAGAYEIESALSDKIIRNVRFSESEKIASHWGELSIDGVKVEIMGALR